MCHSSGGYDLLGDYTSKEGHPADKPDRVFTYPGGDEITAATYDSSGNLYVALNNSKGSRIDEYYPGDTTVDAKYSDGLYDPRVLLTDPPGNLYAANADFGHRDITWYKRGDNSPLHIQTGGLGLLSALAWGDADGWLWVADYTNNALRAYSVDAEKGTSSLAWTICNSNCNLRDDHLHGPTALSEVRGNLYVMNVPSFGSDFVSEYGTPKARDPYWARQIDTYDKFHYMRAIATNLAESLYISELTNYFYGQQRYGIFKYDSNGRLADDTGDMPNPVAAIVVDSYHDWLYAAEPRRDGDVVVYHNKFVRYGVLTKPKGCDFATKLAITPSF